MAGCEGRKMATSTVIPDDIKTLKSDVSKLKTIKEATQQNHM